MQNPIRITRGYDSVTLHAGDMSLQLKNHLTVEEVSDQIMPLLWAAYQTGFNQSWQQTKERFLAMYHESNTTTTTES